MMARRTFQRLMSWTAEVPTKKEGEASRSSSQDSKRSRMEDGLVSEGV
jgi:hypothetical protein